jgi:hypothetical protein
MPAPNALPPLDLSVCALLTNLPCLVPIQFAIALEQQRRRRDEPRPSTCRTKVRNSSERGRDVDAGRGDADVIAAIGQAVGLSFSSVAVAAMTSG